MPTPEMLKKLLDEFAEKEAATSEEIAVITEQIAELEQRIMHSQARLESVAADQERVREMMSHYTEADWAALTSGIKPTPASNGARAARRRREEPTPAPEPVKVTEPTRPAPRASSVASKAVPD